MNAWEEFARSQDNLLRKKYDAIYNKRNEILELRKKMTMVDDPESDPQVQQLKELLVDLDVLEHELSLLQREEYNTLEKYLQLEDLKISAVFPKWRQEAAKPHLKSMSSSSSLSSVSSYDSSVPQISTTAVTPSSDYSSTPGYSFSKNNKIKHALLQDLQISVDGNRSSSGVPSPLPDRLDELLDQIRETRAQLLILRNKKILTERETAKKLALENRLKEQEAKHSRLAQKQEQIARNKHFV
jgi:hypothetical protein